MTLTADQTEDPAQGTEADPPSSDWSVLEWAVIAVIAIPFVIGIIALLGGSDANFRSVGDNALNELRMRDLGHHTLLLGPYSRDGWSHPGPALYYLFAIPYRIFGSRSSAFSACALTLNGAAVVSMVVIARRTSGRLMMLLVAAAGMSYEEASLVAGCSLGTVKSRLARGRAALLRMVEGEDADRAKAWKSATR